MLTFQLLTVVVAVSVSSGAVQRRLYDPDSSDEVDDKDKSKDPEGNEPAAAVQTRTKSDKKCALTRPISHDKAATDTTPVCAESNVHFLIYKSYHESDLYPPWSYRGMYGPKDWHTIDPIIFNFKPPPESESLIKKLAELEAITGANNRLPLAQLTRAETTDEVSEAVLDFYGHVPSFMRFGGYLLENFCGSSLPSPINIDTSKAKIKDSLNEFEYTNFDKKYAIKMYFPEDGTNLLTVRIKDAWGLDGTPCISKGSVTGSDLCFDRLFIRYGIDEQHGSEHQLNNKTFGMEFQFLFTHQEASQRTSSEFFYVRLNEYVQSGYTDKFKIKGKLVRALAVFVEVVEDEESEPNMHILAELAKSFWTKYNPKKLRSLTTKEKIFQFKPFFPDSIYYCYKGSLTFPPCFPDLDWTVFEKPIKISAKDYESFLFIPSEFDDTGFVAGNLRPIESIYVQMEDRKTNKDPGLRAQTLSQRINRDIFKSQPPQDQSKETQYDYYEDDKDSAHKTLRRFCTLDFIILFFAVCFCIVIV